MRKFKFGYILGLGIILLMEGCACVYGLKRVFPNDPGFHERFFQVFPETERTYFTDMKKLYVIDFNDPQQKRKLVYSDVVPYFRFSVSPDEKYLAYVSNDHIVVLDFTSKKKRVFKFNEGNISSIFWSNIAAKKLYFSYWNYNPDGKSIEGIASLVFDANQEFKIITKGGHHDVRICQVLPEDDLVYVCSPKYGVKAEYYLLESRTEKDYLLFKGGESVIYSFAENKLRLSSDKKWAAVSLMDTIWIVRLKDLKGYKVSGQVKSLINYGMDLDIEKGRFYIALAKNRRQVCLLYSGEDCILPLIRAKKYPTQIYLLNLDQILRVFEESPNLLKDFSESFSTLPESASTTRQSPTQSADPR